MMQVRVWSNESFDVFAQHLLSEVKTLFGVKSEYKFKTEYTQCIANLQSDQRLTGALKWEAAVCSKNDRSNHSMEKANFVISLITLIEVTYVEPGLTNPFLQVTYAVFTCKHYVN